MKQNLEIVLTFNTSNQLLVEHDEDGLMKSADCLDLLNRYNFISVKIADQPYAIKVVYSEVAQAEQTFMSIKRLRSVDIIKTLNSFFAQVLDQISPHLAAIPYLNMGENEYIYRFRTAKERNASVYIDADSKSLYQSQLCALIKKYRRNKEKKAGLASVLDFGPVSYVIPSHFGFCLGVQNAIERAYEAIAANLDKRVFMLSELIHNPFVNQDLLKRGIRYIQTDKGIPYRMDGTLAKSLDDPDLIWNQLNPDDIVIIPAFGASNEDKARLIESGIKIREYDATCMLVEKVWKAARRYAREGYTVLIHGKSEHEETKATFSNSSSYGPALMIRNKAHAEKIIEIVQAPDHLKQGLLEQSFSGLYSNNFDAKKDLQKIAVVNQTTLLRNETLSIIEYLKQAYERVFGRENLQYHFWSNNKNDTLCYATQVNQDALHQALENSVDAAIVVGGKNSSNTFQLYRVCEQKYGKRAHYIQSESNILNLGGIQHYHFPYELDKVPGAQEEVRPFLAESLAHQRILITGGASCPDGIIQQVISRINSFFPKEKLRPIEDLLAKFQA